MEDIPKFNENGLWFYEDVGFSRSGTLKATIKALVGNGPAGFTHEELEGLLHLRVYNTLLELVRENTIGRVDLEGTYLYVSPSLERGAEQQNRRQDIRAGIVTTEVVIEILVESLLAGRLRLSAGIVATRLGARGYYVSVEQVERVWAQYGVAAEKKTVRSSRYSRR